MNGGEIENIRENEPAHSWDAGYSGPKPEGLELIKKRADSIREETEKIIVGQEYVTTLILAAILSDGHVLLEGVPGVAKTITAKIIAKTFETEYQRIQFTPDLMPSDILGTSVFNPKTTEFEMRKGPIFSNIILADEINRAPAKTQSALFEVMEERQATIDGTQYEMGFPFLIIATQNPIEQEGTYRLPEAQIDRFLFKIEIGYPKDGEETEILKMKHNMENHLDLGKINAVLSTEGVKKIRKMAHKIHIEESLLKYITNIVRTTRNHPHLYLGASPRASVAMLQTAKAFAAMNGRHFVIPEDIQYMAYPVLRHRIILNSEKEMEGASPDDIIASIIEQNEVPR